MRSEHRRRHGARAPREAWVAAGAAALALATLTACGSQTRTVTVASTPAAEPATAATATTGASSQPATGTAGTTAPTSTVGAATPTTTRSAPEPAFTSGEGSAAPGAGSAAGTVRAHGYTPDDISQYHASQTLQVLVGTRTGSGDGYGQQAFFFLDGRYIGTDAKEASASVKVVSQSDTEVTLAYPLYRPNDPLCCPGAGQATVHFQLDNGRLAALDPIPPASSRTRPSRY